ncbi:tungstate transport system permease protein [Caloramator fervidus]|uniref:Tungstate transport system permease protein n=1 Tax=Caloramator fervidus TaxID=29344 RepID=A0A1H5WAC3_9CLOT|nr:ABC transporter permease [Caloramator fervidus]SEF96509.1 tungstate transport system permease protein [Caloramator fervidus]
MEILKIVITSLYVSLTATFIASFFALVFGMFFLTKQFKLKDLFIKLFDSFTAMPPVLMGLLVFLLLSKNGPLGKYNLLFTPFAMILAQTLLVFPIIFTLMVKQIDKNALRIQKTCYMLGGRYKDFLTLILKECKNEIMTAVTSGFSRAISEVGAVMMVGGNIKGYTRVMTTFIALETSKGNFKGAVLVGVILLCISFIVNAILYNLKGREPNEYLY